MPVIGCIFIAIVWTATLTKCSSRRTPRDRIFISFRIICLELFEQIARTARCDYVSVFCFRIRWTVSLWC